jgi:hypothetical protein
MAAFVKALRNPEGEDVTTTARNSLASHLIAFAAEKSRLESIVVDMETYERQIEEEIDETWLQHMGDAQSPYR